LGAAFHRRVTKSQLQRLVPTNLKLLAAGIDAPEPYAVVIFTHQPVRVGDIRRAVRKVEPLVGEVIVLAGDDFTVEANALAAEKRASVLANGHFGWTEAAYDAIHTSIASKKKFPQGGSAA
jgi:hypothetical protein